MITQANLMTLFADVEIKCYQLNNAVNFFRARVKADMALVKSAKCKHSIGFDELRANRVSTVIVRESLSEQFGVLQDNIIDFIKQNTKANASLEELEHRIEMVTRYESISDLYSRTLNDIVEECDEVKEYLELYVAAQA